MAFVVWVLADGGEDGGQFWHCYGQGIEWRLRDGAAGPLVFGIAKVRVWARRNKKPGPPVWLLVRRSLNAEPEIKYYLCHAEDNTPLETLALVSSCRFRVEEYFEESKSYLGMADYEGRSWTTWHHHMSMVALAHLLVTQTRTRLKNKTPELTLDLAARVLQAALPRPTLSAADALAIIEYHLKRNRIAKRSHHKTWNCKHKDIEYKQLL